MQITSAMKMVSAAKLRKAQNRIIQLRPYAQKMTEILGRLSSSLNTEDNVFSAERETKTVLLVLVTSNRGLCGAFNANVIKKAREIIKQNNDNASYQILTIGKKAFDIYKKTEYLVKHDKLNADNHTLFDNLEFANASEIANHIMDAYAKGTFDKVVVIYNKFKNAATQILETEQLLPIVKPKESTSDNSDYIFEPSKEEIVESLIPKSLKTQFYKAIIDSNAAEHGARMTAMHKATDNAKDLLSNLKLSYNKARQAAITNEILEIVSGANALDDA